MGMRGLKNLLLVDAFNVPVCQQFAREQTVTRKEEWVDYVVTTAGTYGLLGLLIYQTYTSLHWAATPNFTPQPAGKRSRCRVARINLVFIA